MAAILYHRQTLPCSLIRHQEYGSPRLCLSKPPQKGRYTAKKGSLPDSQSELSRRHIVQGNVKAC